MIAITGLALLQIKELLRFYVEEKQRPEAALRFLDCLAEARQIILTSPGGGLSAPRPYPSLGVLGFRWVLQRGYWIGWLVINAQPIVTNVLYASSDIENRMSSSTGDVSDW